MARRRRRKKKRRGRMGGWRHRSRWRRRERDGGDIYKGVVERHRKGMDHNALSRESYSAAQHYPQKVSDFGEIER